jgi:hypothetical protein
VSKKAKKLRKMFAAWIDSLRQTHAAPTLDTWECYVGTHYLPFFVDTDGLTRKRVAAYIRERLAVVTVATVKKERTALRGFIEWALVAEELDPPDWADERPNDPSLLDGWAIDVVNALVPRIPKRARGVAFKQRRRVASFDLEPGQVQALIEALPEWSTSKRVGPFPVRARFIVAYETALRPSTLDRLQVPKHYRIGADRLELSADTDKARYARPVPLSARARQVLDELLKGYGDGFAGLIFGKHDYRQHLKAAAAKALPPQLAEKFAGTHLRAHRITHLLEKGANLLGTQWLAGHKQIATTSRYAKPSFRAALDSLGAV